MNLPSSVSGRLEAAKDSHFKPSLKQRYTADTIFQAMTWISVGLAIFVLVFLLITVCLDGGGRLNWQFLTNFPSRKPEIAGIKSALVGSLWLLAITAAVSFPVGVGAGIFLEEFAPDSWWSRGIEINIGNLAAVPSIIYGLLGLQMFVRVLAPITGGRSLLAGALTLALLILPIIIVSTREALRAVSGALRQGGFALGATRWQVIRELVLPQALPGILTGTILALSRAIGETAPLITIGALTFIAFLPPLNDPIAALQTPFTALPIQIFNWVSRPQADFQANAAAGIIILMIVLLLMNATAIYLRNRFQTTRS
ncbi:MAG: phosphate ABC transporter permease PstA [Thermosynechococcaceae cyanobacterium]